jgi:hypothetical protein
MPTMEKKEIKPDINTKISWDDAEHFYVHDAALPSIKDTAKKFGVSNLSAYKHAARRQWHRKRLEAEKQRQEMAKQEAIKQGVIDLVLRLRRLTRLVDSALDEAAVRPTGEALCRIVQLIEVEREIVDGLPGCQSRHRVLREHVERMLRATGLQKGHAA